jgi:hypothetical protein
MTLETIGRAQADGTGFAGRARWRGRWLMRLSVIDHRGGYRSQLRRVAFSRGE